MRHKKEIKNTIHEMYKYSIIHIVFLLFFFEALAISQTDSVTEVLYTPEFKFADGIYLNFMQVRNDDPIPKSRLITNVEYHSKDFFEQVLDNRYIYFFDQLGIRRQVRTSDIWGFSRNGILYIAMEDGYYRITIVGRICHFVATVTTYDTRYYDPYYYNPYYYNYYRYGGYPSTYSTNELRQYLLDFDTGEVMNYNRESLKVLLMKDPELHDEYGQLRRKKQKQLKFLYLRKFNERNPLYIPVQNN